MNARVLIVPLMLLAAALAACKSQQSADPGDLLRIRAERVESELVQARDKTIGDRSSIYQPALDHLTTLRLALSAANISLAVLPTQLSAPEHREIAYAVLSEAYGNISWNIPILPGRGQRPFPSLFSPREGGLNFNAIRQGYTPQTFATPGLRPEELLGPPKPAPPAPARPAPPVTSPGFVR